MGQIPRTATVVDHGDHGARLVVALPWPAFDAAARSGLHTGTVQWAGWRCPAVPAFLSPLTATLVHAGLVHLGFNLLVFIWCGTQVERVLGRTGLIMLYIVGAYASALLQWLSSPASIVPMIGASGAISAVIGAFALSFGRAKAVHQQSARQPLDQRRVADGRLGRAPGDDGLARRAGRAICWRPRRTSEASPPDCCCSGRCCSSTTARLRPAGCFGRARPSPSGSSRRWRCTTTYFISASSTVRCAFLATHPRQRHSCRNADQVDGLKVEVEALRVLDPATEHQMKLAHAGPLAAFHCRRQPLRAASSAASAEAAQRQ